jgi:Mg-chelatase subunit ChlD
MTSVIDIVFVLDTTGSMYGEIEQAKQSVRKIISSVASINLGDDPNRVKFGFVAYRDHGDVYVTKVHDLSNQN